MCIQSRVIYGFKTSCAINIKQVFQNDNIMEQNRKAKIMLSNIYSTCFVLRDKTYTASTAEMLVHVIIIVGLGNSNHYLTEINNE